MLKNLAIVAILALAGAGGYFVGRELFEDKKEVTEETTTEESSTEWSVAAPGRVEPSGGELRIGTGLLGRVEEVLVKAKDKVEKGELLIRLDDADARAKLASAEVTAEARRDVRESQLPSGREDLRKAEDALYSAERAVTGARIELDYALAAKRNGSGSSQALSNARQRVRDANDRLERERTAYVQAQSKSNLPAPSNAESAFNQARAEVRMAEALLAKTRIRSPIAGTVLSVNTKVGEIVAPSPQQSLAVVGDMETLTVKAEVDATDVSKISINQSAFARSASFPGQEFSGTVTNIAPSLSRPAIHPRGPRLPNDVEVLEVTITLDGNPALLPGMRVDAFFK
jgi:HlyD family secretion protein